MGYIRFAIENPVKVTVAVILLILFGLIALFTIPIQLVPNVDQPVIRVTTTWTGRSPQEVEKEIVEEQEDRLKGVSGLRKMTAQATLGRSEIELEFFVGADMNSARTEVSDKLREVPEYPADVDEPVIVVADAANENAIAWMVLTSDDPEFDVDSLRDAAEDRIKPYLERVAGLSEVNVYGGRDREVHIRIDPSRMAERGVTFSQLRDALQRENLNVSAGEITDGYRDVLVRTMGRFDDLDDVRRTIVVDTEAGPVRIADLGAVVVTLSKRRSFVRSRGQPALALNAIREAGSNVLEVMDGTRTMKGLRQRIDDVNELILPQLGPRLTLTQVYDETVYIYDAVALVQWNLVIGGSLAGVVLLLFLRVVRPTVIVGLSIPVSVVGTFVVMAASGRNINVVSLAGLAFAVGMVVDNAIVVLENIDRHLATGKRPGDAALAATREVWGAILASTLTTIAVFVPVVFMQEEAGQLFRDIAIAIMASVGLSLVVGVTVIPSASARWLRVRAPGPPGPMRRLLGLTTLLRWGTDGFAGLIYRLCARGPTTFALRLLIVALFTAAAIGGAAVLMPPSTYLPSGNRNLVFGVMQTPPAYSLAQNETIAARVEAMLTPYWSATSPAELADLPPVIHPFTGAPIADLLPIENYFFVSFNGRIFMGASSSDKQRVAPLAELLTAAMNTVPGAMGFAFQPSIFGRGVGGGNAVDVEVTGVDIDVVRNSADAIFRALTDQFGFGAVQPDPINFNQAGPEVQIRADRVRAAALGVNMSSLGLAMRALVDGAEIGEFDLGGESIDLLLARNPEYPLPVDGIGAVPVAYHDRDGRVGVVPLSALTHVRHDEAPQEIRRIEERRAVTLTVRLAETVALEEATNGIMAMIAEARRGGQIPPTVDVVPAGTADKLTQARTALLGRWDGWNLDSLKNLMLSRIALALVVTYLLMASLFESFVYPFVIMFTVPLATVGGFIGLALVHAFVPAQQLDVLTMLGFVILIGVVVNNAILVVHQALNFMRGRGETSAGRVAALPHREAIRESVRSRMRPVFMTTLTSISGMLPLVVMPGPGSELYRGLGSVVVGGLLVASLFTLVVVPLLFSVVLDVKQALTGVADHAAQEEARHLGPAGA